MKAHQTQDSLLLLSEDDFPSAGLGDALSALSGQMCLFLFLRVVLPGCVGRCSIACIQLDGDALPVWKGSWS